MPRTRPLPHRALPVLCALLILVGLGGVSLAAEPAPDGAIEGADWPRFRGPSWDGTTRAAGAWTADEPRLDVAWTRSLGSGYAGAVVTDGKVFTAWADGESDWLGAFDTATGDELWRLDLGPRYAGHDGSHDGPLATPVVSGGRVFGLGGHGRFVGASTAGESLWSLELSELGDAPFYGFTSSPTVLDGRVILGLTDSGGAAVHAFDVATGERVWSVAEGKVDYQSPIVTEIGGRQQLIASSQTTLFGIDAATGAVTWSWPHGGDQRAMGAASMVPTPAGDDRLVIQPSLRGAKMVRVHAGAASSDAEDADAETVDEVWSNNDVGFSYVPPVISAGRVFAYQRGFLAALDVESGELVWKSRPPGDGFLAAAGDRLVVATKKGTVHLADATADSYRELARADVFGDAIWSTPAVAGERIYVRGVDGLAALDVVRADSPRRAAWPGAELPDTAFGRFIRGLESAEDRAATIDAFLAENETTPLVEGGWAHFVYRGAVDAVGIEGDMFGDRVQEQMLRVPDTDLFYRSVELPRDSWVSYRIAPGTDEPAPDPRNPARIPDREGDLSVLAMPEWPTPSRVDELAGRVVEHQVEVTAPELPDGAPQGEDAPDLSQRRVDVLVPAGYFDGEEQYPLVVVFDGESARQSGHFEHYADPLLAAAVPPAVVAFVYDYPYPGRGPGAIEATASTLFDGVMPFLERTYRVASTPRAYVGMGFGGTGALFMGLHGRADAEVVVAVQPFSLDAQRRGMEQMAAAPREARPRIVLENSTFDLRAEHEGWDIADQSARLVDALRGQGYEVELTTTHNGFHWGAWASRIEPALRAALGSEAP
ncbi:MAG: PQQ-binding-like beta-propeller repeat protein [Acidobacteriota bacterium]